VAKRVRISLANKCQLLFGGAVLLILVAALSVGWLRMRTLVREGQEATARKLAEAWLEGRIVLGDDADASRSLQMSLIDAADFDARGDEDEFIAKAIHRLSSRGLDEYILDLTNERGEPVVRYVRGIRDADLARRGEPAVNDEPDALRQLLVVDLRSEQVRRQLMLNRIYVIAAGLLAGLLAIATFWFITTRLILSPVRLLRRYAEQVSEGNLKTRSDINTGDEFEQLSDMFNTMLDRLEESHDDLSSAKKSLDLRLNELAESNVALYEANKIKGEFLANVSHELRTPLNSIIGFAEVLEDTLPAEDSPAVEKRKRYLRNIIMSSRRLLDLINDLLDLAKIEAGRMDLNIGAVSVADTCEGLVNLMRPQAEKRQVELALRVRPGIPLVQTDAGRLQQILFNFLSNAVKFTPDGGTVTVTADTIPPMPTRRSDSDAFEPTHVRINVKDQGPGIDPRDHDRIFDKFTQLDPTVTKEHGGTGLGLTISRDLARLLGGRIEIDSAAGQGATFSLVIPFEIKPQSAPLMPDLSHSTP
jgi:two-component system sensor histidine kinase BarA